MKKKIIALAIFALASNAIAADTICGKFKSISAEPQGSQKGWPLYMEILTDQGTIYKPFIYGTLVPLATAALAADLNICVEKKTTPSGDPGAYKMSVTRP